MASRPAAACRGATDYLALALNPDEGEADAAALVKPEVVTESGLVERDLADYDCVFLANVGQFTASEASLLEAYLEAGGGLVFFLGDQVLPDRYNRELLRAGGGVLPARIEGAGRRGAIPLRSARLSASAGQSLSRTANRRAC